MGGRALCCSRPGSVPSADTLGEALHAREAPSPASLLCCQAWEVLSVSEESTRLAAQADGIRVAPTTRPRSPPPLYDGGGHSPLAGAGSRGPRAGRSRVGQRPEVGVGGGAWVPGLARVRAASWQAGRMLVRGPSPFKT